MSKREPWWIWHWDRVDIRDVSIPRSRITRWRRGSFLTVYRHEGRGDTQWWFYGPGNLAIGFSYPTDRPSEETPPNPTPNVVTRTSGSVLN